MKSTVGRNVILVVLLFGIFVFDVTISMCQAQGSLTPPGAPAASMKSLAQIEPRTPISSLPYTITSAGSYYLTTNLTGITSSSGLTISSGDVILDLNGFRMSGVPGSYAGIFINSTWTNIVIRNGIINGWGNDGIYAHNGTLPRNMLFENLMITANGSYGIETEAGNVIRDCMVMSNRLDGIYNLGGRISGCLLRGNGGNGIFASSCVLDECVAEYNTSSGIRLLQGAAKDCTAQFNGQYGFSLQGGSANNCLSQNNNSGGILCDPAGNEVRACRIYNNTNVGVYLNGNSAVLNNYVAANASYGILVAATGCEISGNSCVSNALPAIFVLTGYNHIDNNSMVTSSGVTGISVVNTGSTNNIVTRNRVIGDGSSGFSIVAGNDVGPIGNLSTNTSPWANVSH